MSLVPDLLGFAKARVPDRPAVICEQRTLSFRAVDERANRLASCFRQWGLNAGDRVALFAKNEAEFLEIQVASMRTGVVLVPMNFRLALPEVEYIVSDATPKVFIGGSEFAEISQQVEAERHLVLGDDYEAALNSASPANDPYPLISGEAPSLILYTSGTTGRPKGALLSNNALLERVNTNLFEYWVKPEDIFLQCLPLFHIASNVTSSYAYVGATNVLLKDFDPAVVLELITQHRISSTLLVPTMINALIHHRDMHDTDLSHLHTVIYGASPIPPTVLQGAISALGCGFVQAFGMTETSACTVLRREDHDPVNSPELLPSAGRPAVGMQVRVVDEMDRDLASGEVGEVVCRGRALMDGYWNAEEATAEAMRGGWMHTGDMGYCDANGYLFITDRKKDMIVSGGENIYPREVEDVLFEHPGVLEAAVIGVPDDRWGERVHAALVPEAGVELDVAEVLTFARARLAGYKVPKSAEVMSDLPKNVTGKVLKTELRKPWWETQSRGVG
jgi:acyl-CoA synthetase (AMP-forming)/AMP-acid ligase II